MPITPYLDFDGRCDEAFAFYRQALGAEVTMLMRFGESPDPLPPGMQVPAEKVMHAALRIGDGTIMASDMRCTGRPSIQGISLSLEAPDDAQARRWFDALADGGQVQMPMDRTFFASSFGVVVDRFGVSWMVLAAAAPAG
jgi:PhnB protein